MTFSEALIELKSGKVIRRKRWTGKLHFLLSRQPDSLIYLMTTQRQIIPWWPDSKHIDAMDWEIFNGELPGETKIIYPTERANKAIEAQLAFLT